MSTQTPSVTSRKITLIQGNHELKHEEENEGNQWSAAYSFKVENITPDAFQFGQNMSKITCCIS